MSTLLAFTELDIDVGDLNVQSCKVHRTNTYLEVVDLGSEEATQFLVVLDHTGIEVQNSRELKNLFKEHPIFAETLLNLPEAQKFPLSSFSKSGKHMDAARIIKNIETVTTNGMSVEHAINIALLAEYGVVGDRAGQFAHTRTFEEMQIFLDKTFPDGPTFSGSAKIEPGGVSVKFGAVVQETAEGIEVGEILIPKGVDTGYALTTLANEMRPKAHPRPVGTESHI